MKLLFTLAMTITLTACSHTAKRELVGSLVAGAADTKVGYNAQQCTTIEMRCVEGDYQQWQTSDGTEGCSCKRY
ncbi:hypothetical protein LJ739_16335 [Aestuariibacter halophilus]|uniref:Lipoprotein n=1 Tax=Fluctibacter halophilus TaxID=226011 RepID=A0ABS8GF52_9ALTE|nr:hypothetical protein [Aestuariibacter halophilus]MCC2617821.1 hypothetical protein [Aestuariibacter halophilus]